MNARPPRPRVVALTGAILLAATDAGAQVQASASPTWQPTWRAELRRQHTDRGAPNEGSKTTLRFERYFTDTTVTRLRLDLQFPDDKQTFPGAPLSPQLGDAKLRANFRPFLAGDVQLGSDVEVTVPSADPSTAGSGKYQLSAALYYLPSREPDYTLASGRHQLRWEGNIRQTVSVAGLEDRTNIDNTKLEIALRDTIGPQYWLKLTCKPTIDWIKNGHTGSVLELEGGWNASRAWRFSVMAGGRLWGETDVAGTYGTRLEITASRAF